MSRPRLGFIGLGLMGAPMVRRLLAQGWEATVWNLEPDRAAEVTGHGAAWAEGPAAVRAASDLVLLCVLDEAAVRDVCLGPGGLAEATWGADLVIDLSTVPPDVTRAIAADLRARAGLAWVDAPVSGGPDPAERGELTILVGGSDEDVARARPVLDALGRTVTHQGPLGAGQAAKTLNQALVGVGYVLAAEVLALARRAGLDAAGLPAALAGGMADSQILQRIYPQMEREAFEPPKAYARQLAKDLAALRAFAGALGGGLPLIERAAEVYEAYAKDHPKEDSASISRAYSRRDDV